VAYLVTSAGNGTAAPAVLSRTEYTYDNLNHVLLTVVRSSNSPTGTVVQATGQVYDELGRVCQTQLINPAATNYSSPGEGYAQNSYLCRRASSRPCHRSMKSKPNCVTP
jgi:hypothetical protein